MNTYSLYKLDTGLFTGVAYTCHSDHIDINIPDDCGCVVGEFDKLNQKIDPNSGLVVDYIPPQPASNYIWNKDTKCWIYQDTDDDVAFAVKTKRHSLLTETDWLSIRNLDGTKIPDEWKAYRQDLRDITKQEGFPRNVVWPSIPRQAI